MRLSRMPTGVVFDMEGLLFDSEALYRDAARAAAAAVGRDLPDQLFLSLIGGSEMGNRARLHANVGPAFDLEAFEASWMRDYATRAGDGPALKAGVRALLAVLDTDGLKRDRDLFLS